MRVDTIAQDIVLSVHLDMHTPFLHYLRGSYLNILVSEQIWLKASAFSKFPVLTLFICIRIWRLGGIIWCEHFLTLIRMASFKI